MPHGRRQVFATAMRKRRHARGPSTTALHEHQEGSGRRPALLPLNAFRTASLLQQHHPTAATAPRVSAACRCSAPAFTRSPAFTTSRGSFHEAGLRAARCARGRPGARRCPRTRRSWSRSSPRPERHARLQVLQLAHVLAERRGLELGTRDRGPASSSARMSVHGRQAEALVHEFLRVHLCRKSPSPITDSILRPVLASFLDDRVRPGAPPTRRADCCRRECAGSPPPARTPSPSPAP